MGTIQTFYWPLKRSRSISSLSMSIYIAPSIAAICYYLLTIKQGVIGVRQLQPENKTKPLFFPVFLSTTAAPNPVRMANLYIHDIY